MKKHLSTIILLLVFLVGLSLLLYPSVSDWWNSQTQSRAIATYSEAIAQIDPAVYEEARAAAQEYNRSLIHDIGRLIMSDEERAQYDQLLNLTGDGIMGIIEIPVIDVNLPIYHGTSERVLQSAVGHIEGTSLPVGGSGTHCAMSGHRGLPSARLFTDLDKLVVGDIFLLTVLDEVLTYQVDLISIVEPHEVNALNIEEGKDYCTLVTCTPYGINTHRLMVRGRRIATEEEKRVVVVTADAIQVEPLLIAPVIGVPLLVLLTVAALAVPNRRRRKRKSKKE